MNYWCKSVASNSLRSHCFSFFSLFFFKFLCLNNRPSNYFDKLIKFSIEYATKFELEWLRKLLVIHHIKMVGKHKNGAAYIWVFFSPNPFRPGQTEKIFSDPNKYWNNLKQRNWSLGVVCELFPINFSSKAFSCVRYRMNIAW